MNRGSKLKARYVFPVAGGPIADGVVTVDGRRIAAVGRRPPGGEVEDLGNVAILPGLVNAHTHLEFSDLSGPLGEPGMDFADWLRCVVQYRLSKTARRPTEEGLQESVRSGTTTLGEIAQPGWPIEQIESAALDTTVFLELIAPTAERVGPALELAREHLLAARASSAWQPGLSPHAPYSVHPELLARVASLSVAQRVPIAFHLAESREELELLHSHGGPFRELLDGLGAWDPGTIPRATRPMDYLRTLACAHRALVIHGNYLDEEEIAFLAEHAERMAVVYCPRTHAYFRRGAYPLEKLLSAGATVALGTDSRASSPDLSVLAEMRLVAQEYPAVGRDVVLQLGTIRAARALGRDHEVGSLAPGKLANLAVVALPERDAADPHDLLLNSHEPVVAGCYQGARTKTG